MANKWRLIQGVLSSADSGTKDFTLSGFGTPDAAYVLMTPDTSGLTAQGATGNADYHMSLGLTDGSKHRVFTFYDEDGLGTTNTMRRAHNTGGDLIFLMDNVGAELVAYDFNSFITDGIKLNVGSAPASGTMQVSIMLIQADNVELVDLDNTGGTQTVTSLAFQPNMLIGGGCDVAYGATATADASFFFGVASDNGTGTDQIGMWVWSDDAATRSDPWHNMTDGAMVTQGTDIAGDDGGWDITAWSSTGFTCTVVNSDGVIGAVLAIDTGTTGVWVGVANTKTTTGVQAYTGPGWTPQMVGILATREASGTWNTRVGNGNAGTHAIGHAHGTAATAQHSVHFRTEENKTTTESKNDQVNSIVYMTADDSGVGAGDLLHADLDSFTASGFDLDFLATSGTARQWGFFAIEEEDTAQTVSPASISSTEALGTAAFTAIMNLTLASLPSAEAFGVPAFSLDLTFPSIAPAEAFGVAQFDLAIALPSMASLEAFGTLALSVDLTFPSIGSDEGFGTLIISQGGQISPASIAPAEAFGTAQFDIDVNFSGIASAEGLGLPTISGADIVAPASIPPAEAFGTAQFDINVTFPSIPSAEVVPSPLIDASLTFPSISGEEAFGTPVMVAEHALSGLGNIASGEAFGTATFTGGLDPIIGRSIFIDVIVPFHASLDIECAEFAAGIDIILPGEDVT